jgi:hypothetical protein
VTSCTPTSWFQKRLLLLFLLLLLLVLPVLVRHQKRKQKKQLGSRWVREHGGSVMAGSRCDWLAGRSCWGSCPDAEVRSRVSANRVGACHDQTIVMSHI